ncbi:MAG: hypothetical protein A2X78_00640 [Gammaproteobacteria bacterium GWE2_37_16]|nr:MAG: hypothetical protein A2X78_00640 [Gammaproteobacteria bacterium GWE2_37_16]
MIKTYHLSDAAYQDIDEIVTYIAKESPKSAHKFLDATYSAMDTLAENPDLGHLREDLTQMSVKFWTFKWHYLIIYKPMKPIEIVRILSGYQDITNIIN